MISSSKLLEQFTSGTSHSYWLSCLGKTNEPGDAWGNSSFYRAIPFCLDSRQQKTYIKIQQFSETVKFKTKSTMVCCFVLVSWNMLKQCETRASNMSILGCQGHILLCCYGIIFFGSFHCDINLGTKIEHKHFSPGKAKSHSIYFVALSFTRQVCFALVIWLPLKLLFNGFLVLKPMGAVHVLQWELQQVLWKFPSLYQRWICVNNPAGSSTKLHTWYVHICPITRLGNKLKKGNGVTKVFPVVNVSCTKEVMMRTWPMSKYTEKKLPLWWVVIIGEQKEEGRFTQAIHTCHAELHQGN